MAGEEIAREIVTTISTQYGIASNLVIAMMHDRAACNGVALRTLKNVYPQLVDVGSFSHTKFSRCKVLHSPSFILHCLVGQSFLSQPMGFRKRELAEHLKVFGHKMVEQV